MPLLPGSNNFNCENFLSDAKISRSALLGNAVLFLYMLTLPQFELKGNRLLAFILQTTYQQCNDVWAGNHATTPGSLSVATEQTRSLNALTHIQLHVSKMLEQGLCLHLFRWPKQYITLLQPVPVIGTAVQSLELNSKDGLKDFDTALYTEYFTW